MEIGGITIEMPGESGQTMGQSIADVIEQIRKAFDKAMEAISKDFTRVTKGTKNGVSAWNKLLEEMSGKTLKKTVGSLKRAVLGFDELNRLAKNTGVAGAVQQNKELSESVEAVVDGLGEAAKDLNDNVISPVTNWGKDTVSNILGNLRDIFSGGLFGDGMDAYQRRFMNLNRETQIWNELTGDAYVVGNAFTELLEQTGHRTQMASIFMQEMGGEVNGLSGEFSRVGQSAQTGWDGVKNNFSQADSWFQGSVTEPVRKSLGGLWDSVPADAQESWTDTKGVFSDAGGFFETTFSNAWSRITRVFSKDGTVYTSLQEGILAAFKKTANGLISGINTVVAKPFTGLNQMLNSLQKLKIGNLQPFASMSWRAEVPKIPYLAKGAVLPANKPFMAVVGDQRHGTNVEAPLTTIQEAVAAVMQEHTQANMAGHSATVQVLRQILEAVLGIHISDETIACAYDRYQHQLGIVNGR